MNRIYTDDSSQQFIGLNVFHILFFDWLLWSAVCAVIGCRQKDALMWLRMFFSSSSSSRILSSLCLSCSCRSWVSSRWWSDTCESQAQSVTTSDLWEYYMTWQRCLRLTSKGSVRFRSQHVREEIQSWLWVSSSVQSCKSSMMSGGYSVSWLAGVSVSVGLVSSASAPGLRDISSGPAGGAARTSLWHL